MSEKNQQQKNVFKLNKGLYFINVDNFKDSTPENLWENKTKKNFFTWLFSFALMLSIFCIITLLQVIFWIVDKNLLLNLLENIYGDKNSFFSIDSQYIWNENLAQFVFSFAFQLLTFILLIRSIYICFKNKSFKFISFLPTAFIFVQAISSLFYVFSLLLRGSNALELFSISWVFVIQFIMPFLYILTWFFISRNVSLIRNIAFQAEIRANFTKQFNEQEDIFQRTFNQTNDKQKKEQENKAKNDEFYNRLKNLNRNQLNDIAQSLAISGYEDMSDEELINIMRNIKKAEIDNSKEIVVEIEKEENEKNEDKNKNQ